MSIDHGSPEVVIAVVVLLIAVVVHYWRVIVAALAVAVLSFTIIGVLTLVQALEG